MNSDIVLSKLIREVNRTDALTKLLDLVTWSYKFVRYKTTDKDSAEQVADLYTTLLGPDFKNLTLKDISNAFQGGVTYKYGEFTGLSVAVYCKWIRAYMKDYKSQVIQPNFGKIDRYLQETPPPPQDQLDAMNKENYDFCLSFFKQNGRVPAMCYGAFIHAQKVGMEMNPQKENHLRSLARNAQEAKLKREREFALSRGEAKSIDRAIDIAVNGSVSYNNEVWVLALTEHFSLIINSPNGEK